LAAQRRGPSGPAASAWRCAVNATAKWPTGARTHQKTAKLVGKHHQLLTTFCPIDDNMNASAKGTVETLGKNIDWPD
jgi:hypothetical protein